MNTIFQARSLSKKCEAAYLDRYFPNSRLLEREEYKNRYGLETLPYSALSERECWGMLYSLERDGQGELSVTLQENAHTLVVGTTQVGKTWGHVMDSLGVLSAKKNKPQFMITDPKGEIYKNMAPLLRSRGYRVYSLNFKNVSHSDTWNPLLEIYDSYVALNRLEKALVFQPTLIRLGEFEMTSTLDEFERLGGFWAFDGKAIADRADADLAVANKRADIESETCALVDQLVDSMGAPCLDGCRDPGWPQGAMEILRGMIYLMLEDALDERSGFRREHMNFMNMQRYYEILREGVLNTASYNTVTPLLKNSKLFHKRTTDESLRHMRGFFENAPPTTRSYLGYFDNLMRNWFTPKLYSLANDQSVELDDGSGSPFAIFLVTRDYEKSDYFIAGLFVDWLYRQMLSRADAAPEGKLERELFFILDEFANIPVISAFSSKISTALSRRIVFQLYVQSYEQIESNYGAADAETIRANCNVELFLGSQSHQTKKTFSEKCGNTRVRALESVLCPDKCGTVEIPVLSINRLEELERGEGYLKRLNRPPSKTHFEMAYLCKEFRADPAFAYERPKQKLPYNDSVYVYSYLHHDRPMAYYGASAKDRVADQDIA